MTGKNFTSEELVGRFEDQRDLRNLMGKLSYLGILKRECEVFSRFWSSREDVCLGINEGWYLGPQAVSSYYLAYEERAKYDAHYLKTHFSDKTVGKTEKDLYGAGVLNIKPVDTAVIEIAADGATAKGIWFCRGSDNELKPTGPVADWIFGCFAVDFIREENWKIWHMLYFEDIRVPAGKNWGAAVIKNYPTLPEFHDVDPFVLPEPTVPETLYERYTPTRPKTRLPEPPVPYETFSETFSYGR